MLTTFNLVTMVMIKSTLEIFICFFRLGLVSFGGPAAHLGYFQQEFVNNKQWLSQGHYANLLALSQFLPGPGSSQVGFAIGLHRAGLLGAMAAFTGFTLPSALLMTSLALVSQLGAQLPWMDGLIAGLKISALVVVIEAVSQMYKQFCHNKYLITACVLSCCALLLVPSITNQLSCLAAAALSGRLLHKRLVKPQNESLLDSNNHAGIRWLYLGIFVLLMVLTLLPTQSNLATFSHFYQAGSWVFGGGHVVLPILQQSLAQQLSPDQLLSAYAAAQAVPGPMFSIASYLGAIMSLESPILGATLATIAIFLPGLLLVLAFVDVWQVIAQQTKFAAAIQMLNAAVVGLLVAAMYQPIFSSAVSTNLDMVCVLLGLFLLRVLKLSVLWLLVTQAFTGAFLLG